MIDEAGKIRKEIIQKVELFLKDLGHDIDVLYDFTIRDEKTGLYKLRFFNSIFEMEKEKVVREMKKRTKSNTKGLSMMVIDIDNFRMINTNHGHLVGDDVIVALAKLLLKTMRKSDVVARFGGEEFVILLPETGTKAAKNISKRIRTLSKNDKTLKKYEINFSAGVATLNLKDTRATLFKKADKALYKAKNNGKDRTEVAD